MSFPDGVKRRFQGFEVADVTDNGRSITTDSWQSLVSLLLGKCQNNDCRTSLR